MGESDVIVDLDDEDVPMANIDLDDANKTSKMPLIASAALGGIGIIALIILVILFIKKRR